jgi:hypothetical protein
MKTAIGTVAFLVLVTNFASAAEERQSSIPPERAAAAREALTTWFECVECTHGELDRVLRYQREVEDALINVLRTGLSPAKQAEIELELHAQARANGWKGQRVDEYVRTSLSNADEAYRLRAIKALARIGTDDAKGALKEAAGTSKSARIRSAAKKAAEPTPPR